MLTAFVAGVGASSRAPLHAPDLPIPFANLETAKGQRQRHGITGVREPGAWPGRVGDDRLHVERIPRLGLVVVGKVAQDGADLLREADGHW
jgi:hypothetical protein